MFVYLQSELSPSVGSMKRTRCFYLLQLFIVILPFELKLYGSSRKHSHIFYPPSLLVQRSREINSDEHCTRGMFMSSAANVHRICFFLSLWVNWWWQQTLRNNFIFAVSPICHERSIKTINLLIVKLWSSDTEIICFSSSHTCQTWNQVLSPNTKRCVKGLIKPARILLKQQQPFVVNLLLI